MSVFSVHCDLKGILTPHEINCKTVFSPDVRLKLAHQQCVPVWWIFALCRALTKLCSQLEPHDIGLAPLATSRPEMQLGSPTAEVRLKASALAVKLLLQLLSSVDGWNRLSDYPKEALNRAMGVFGNNVLFYNPPSRQCSRNVSSFTFSQLIKLGKLKPGRLEIRFFWNQVEELEKLMILTLFQKLEQSREFRCLLTQLTPLKHTLLQGNSELHSWFVNPRTETATDNTHTTHTTDTPLKRPLLQGTSERNTKFVRPFAQTDTDTETIDTSSESGDDTVVAWQPLPKAAAAPKAAALPLKAAALPKARWTSSGLPGLVWELGPSAWPTASFFA